MEVRKRTPETRTKHLSILVHGWSGSGKTHFGGTVSQAGIKTLYVVSSPKELTTLDTMGIKDYDYIILTDYSRAWDLYLTLRSNKNGYEAVVLDGLTEIQQFAKDRAVAEGDIVPYEGFVRGERRVGLRDWGTVLEMMRHFLTPFIRLPMHKVVTCLSEVDVDPKDGSPVVYPLVQGTMQQLLPAYFSTVGFATVISSPAGEAYYCMTTQAHPNLRVKDEIAPRRLYENPKFGVFLRQLNGEEVKQTETEARLQRLLTIRPTAKSKIND